MMAADPSSRLSVIQPLIEKLRWALDVTDRNLLYPKGQRPVGWRDLVAATSELEALLPALREGHDARIAELEESERFWHKAATHSETDLQQLEKAVKGLLERNAGPTMTHYGPFVYVEQADFEAVEKAFKALREGHRDEQEVSCPNCGANFMVYEDDPSRVEPLGAGVEGRDLPRTGNEPSPSLPSGRNEP
jgi:hypothetical protein